jgi:hypothetical protein
LTHPPADTADTRYPLVRIMPVGLIDTNNLFIYGLAPFKSISDFSMQRLHSNLRGIASPFIAALIRPVANSE